MTKRLLTGSELPEHAGNTGWQGLWLDDAAVTVFGETLEGGVSRVAGTGTTTAHQRVLVTSSGHRIVHAWDSTKPGADTYTLIPVDAYWVWVAQNATPLAVQQLVSTALGDPTQL